jgi:N-acetylglucosaminyldiphosphoundecaprenol N-acetyl-beta-D-mannosaminyltransferase
MPPANRVKRANILGVGVSAVNMDQTLAVIDNWIAHLEPNYVCVTGVHGIIESQKDPEIQRIHNSAGLVTPDGMPLVWLCHLLGHKHVERVYGPDLLLAICANSIKKGYRHFFYGGKPGVAGQLVENLRRQFPGLQVTGYYSPPFRSLNAEEESQILQEINSCQPHIVWIGLSTPKQERWMVAHVGLIENAILIGVGAAFDFHAGAKKQAPRWIQRSGLEWLFRLASEPGRLWKRYLVNNPLFVILIIAQALKIKRYEISGATDETSRDER